MWEPIRFFRDGPFYVLGSKKMHGNMKASAKEGKKNRRNFLNSFFFPEAERRLFFANVAHEDGIVVVNGDPPKDFNRTDALIMFKKLNTLIALTFADCPPITLTAYTRRNNPIVALVHAGYKPLLQKIAFDTVQKMVAVGARRRSIQAIIGPGICRRCYEFGSEAPQVFSAYPEYLREAPVTGKFFIDLPGIIRWQLKSAGVKKVVDSHICTYENRNIFSARRDKKKPIEAGMIVAGIR